MTILYEGCIEKIKYDLTNKSVQQLNEFYKDRF
jgi:hypothetical protein